MKNEDTKNKYAYITILAKIGQDAAMPLGKWIGDLPPGAYFSANVLNGITDKTLNDFVVDSGKSMKRAIELQGVPK